MEKHNKVTVSILIVATLIVVSLCAYSVKKHPEIETSDAIKFKEEYESLNGVVDEITNEVYSNVIISSDNPIIYKSDEEILDLLNSETAIVYFGYASCNECREVLKSLLDIAKDYPDKKVYYVDIKDIRDTFILNDGNVEQTKEGTNAYQEILKKLKEYLYEYYIEDEDGEKYDTKTTRLNAPTIVAIKEGKIKSFYDLASNDIDNINNDLVNTFESVYASDVCETSISC